MARIRWPWTQQRGLAYVASLHRFVSGRRQLGSALSANLRDDRREHRCSLGPSVLQVKIFPRLPPSSLDPLKLALLGLCAWAVLLGSCSQTPITVTLHALQSSGRVSFVCRGDDNSPAGHKLDECPDYDHGTRRTLALVTQTATHEVAIVDLQAAQSIVDIDPTTPGYSFLRVGARPGAIVTTPGGAASFVGVSGPAQERYLRAAHDVLLVRPTKARPHVI